MVLFGESREDAPDDGRGKSEILLRNRTAVSLGCTVAFGVLSLMGLAHYVNPTDLNYARLWRDQPWAKQQCSVVDVGVAYRGNCHMNVDIMMTEYSNFEECLGGVESERDAQLVREAWDDTQAGECADQGDKDYLLDTGHTLQAGETAEQLEKEAEGRRLAPPDLASADDSWLARPPVASLRRLSFTGATIMNLPNRLDCHNSYLLWALMEVPNSTKGRPGNASRAQGKIKRRCSYEFGSSAPSIAGEWAKLKKQKAHLEAHMHAGAKVPCWILQDDDCVVAFHSESLLTAEKSTENFEIEASGAMCGIGWIVSLILSLRFFLEDIGWIHPEPERGYHWYHHALPTAEHRSHDLDVQLSDRVRHIMGVAGAHIGEITPDPSGQSTLRTEASGCSEHTVKIVGADGIRKAVPRNVAADFLAERPAEV